MLEIEYCEDGEAVSDFKAIEYVKDLYDFATKNNITVSAHVSSEIVIQAARVLIAEGRILHNQVVFIFKEEKITADKYGRMQRWPKGFCDISLDFCSFLLGCTFTKESK